MLNKKMIKKIDKAADVLGRAMIFTLLIVLATEFIIIGIFGFKIFYANAQTAPNKEAVNPANVPQIALPVGDFYRECAVCAAKDTAEKQNACYAGFDSTKCFDVQHPENWIGQYVQAWFNYLVGAIGIIAVVMVMWGGIKWITSGGNSSQIEEAKGKIKNAVIGIVLLLGAYTIFTTVNPQLLNLSLPPIEGISEGTEICCQNSDSKTLRITFDLKCDEETENTIPNVEDCKLSAEAIKAGCPPGTTGVYKPMVTGNNPIMYLFTEEVAQTYGTIECKKLNKELQSFEQRLSNGSFGVLSICYTCKESGSASTATDEAQIRAELESAGIGINYENACLAGQTSGCTSVAGMKQDTIEVLVNLAKNDKVGGENVVITGGTEKGHTSKHTLGWGVDLRKTEEVTKYVLNNYTGEPSIRSDGATVYTVGNVKYALELDPLKGDHWDLCVSYCSS